MDNMTNDTNDIRNLKMWAFQQIADANRLDSISLHEQQKAAQSLVNWVIAQNAQPELATRDPRPTSELRWKGDGEYANKLTLWLEQKWVNEAGEAEWRRVPQDLSEVRS